jgi:Ca-activated chloride channel family protein
MSRLLVGLLLLISQDTLQVKVSLVSVGVRVTDSRDRSVLGLKAGDFSVFDNGVAQKIEFFSSDEQPVTMGILVDHSSSMSSNAKLDRAKEAARDLVHATHEGSEYFYIAFDENVRLAADFTTDRDKIDSAIQQTGLGGGTSLYDAIVQGLTLCRTARLPRQVLVIISDGADQHSHYELRQIMSLIRESEVQVYTIGYFDENEERQYRAADRSIQLVDGREIDNPRRVLNDIAPESGGVAFFPKSDTDLARAVDEIKNDLRSQYTLAFYPPSAASEGGYHQLRVTVRGGRYSIRARPGYGTADIPIAPARKDGPPPFESKIEHRAGRIFYRDDFSDQSSGWPNRETARYSSRGYQLTGQNVVTTNGPIFHDFRASVTVAVSRPMTGAGLIFRLTDNTYYVLAAYPGTSLRGSGSLVALQVNASGTTELDRWPLIRQANPKLKLEVRCTRDTCAVYQEDNLRGQIKNIVSSEGRIGLCLIGGGSALFTDLSAEEIR